MPQFGLLLFMVMLPMQILSGAGGIIRAQALSGLRAEIHARNPAFTHARRRAARRITPDGKFAGCRG